MSHHTDPKLPGWSAYLDRLEGQAHHVEELVHPQEGGASLHSAAQSVPAQECSGPQAVIATGRCKEALFARFSLGMWGFYFLAKLGMYWMALMNFHPLENIALAGFILLPVTTRTLRKVQHALIPLFALMLLYYDSWLPPVRRLISQATWWTDFSFSYFVELLMRFISLPVIGTLLIAGAAYWVLSHLMRTGAVVMFMMLLVGVMQSSLFEAVEQKLENNPAGVKNVRPDMDRVLQKFFDREAERSVLFSRPSPKELPFDVVFIHVCSLSWDDLRAVGLEDHPLWRRFDMVFKRFNSAASYSAPAVIHLLRATCGQQSHEKAYLPVPEKCYLMNSLQASGFDPNLALNFTGNFDNFIEQVQTHGNLRVPLMSQSGLDIAQYAFNESVIYDDLSVLNRWLSVRQRSSSARVALFYNTISLHDGNHYPGADALPSTLKNYEARLRKFLDEMDVFMQNMENAGRRAVVVMVPEHGAAVRGDKQQMPGLREIPTPNITLVPVGVKFIGAQREGAALSIDQPTSYLAVSHLIARMLEASPYAGAGFSPVNYVSDLPETPFVAQNDRTTVAEYNHRYYINRNSEGWEDYAEFNASVTPR